MNKELIFVTHRIDLRGGQERSMHENLKRLAATGYHIHFYTYELENWPSDLPHTWTKVPGKTISIQILRNFWFSFYTAVLLVFKKSPIMTIGTASWIADFRVVQFVHLTYRNLAKNNLAPLPNAKTKSRQIYQLIVSAYNSFLEKFLFPQTKAFVAISHSIESEIKNIIRDKNIPISVIHHAPDEVEIGLKAQSPLRVLFVGALERKGIEKSLRLLSHFKSKNFIFDVVGPGNIPYWKKYAIELGLEDKVIFHGMKPSFQFFSKAHLFLFPSTYEPFGLVVSEAASFYCLPLASNECGAMELWPSRPEWLNLSALDDDHLWLNALEKLIDSPDLLESLSKDANKAFMSWSWQKSAMKYKEFFEKFA